MSVEESFYAPSAPDLLLTGPAQEAFHQRAFAAAREMFGREVFVRAVVEVSNFCRQNCVYCGMRRDNRALTRFRAEAGPLAELILSRRPPSVTDINIQAGEDPVAVREVVLPLIHELRRESSLGVSVCLGSLQEDLYDQLREAGASIYILKFETSDPQAYARWQSPGTLDNRVKNLRYLSATGWSVSSGFIAGLPGQDEEALLQNIEFAAGLPLDGCSASPFIPGDETPLARERRPGIDLTLNCMAAMRLARPDWIIPAVSALNLAEPGLGYRRGLRTGANLVTINMTPPVLREDYLLYKRDRFIMTEEVILEAIESVGLQPSRAGLARHFASRKARLAVA